MVVPHRFTFGCSLAGSRAIACGRLMLAFLPLACTSPSESSGADAVGDVGTGGTVSASSGGGARASGGGTGTVATGGTTGNATGGTAGTAIGGNTSGGAGVDPSIVVTCDGPQATDPSSLDATVEGIAPSRFNAASGKGKVLLLWNAPAGATTFAIYRGTKSGEEGASPIANGVSGIKYVDTAAMNGTRYYYRVAVAGGAHAGAMSEEASAQPTDADPAAAFQAVVTSANPFASKVYASTPISTYDACKLPQPILDDHPEWLPLYTKAWQLAFKDLKQPTQANGFVSNYIDPAFYGHIFQWDTVFMLEFASYAHPYAVTIGSLDNFYAKQHADGFICREIDEANGHDILYTGSINDAVNPPLYSWAEWRYYELTGDGSRLASAIIPIAKHYDWLRKNHALANGAYWNTGFGAGEDDLKRKNPTSWVDMTAQQAQNAIFSAFMATASKNDSLSAFFVEEYLSLAKLLHDRFWDSTTTLFTDLASDGTPTHVKTSLAFWPLIAGVASLDQMNALASHLQNPAEFWRPNVVPVLAADQDGYTADGNYWNGAVWAPTNYVVMDGLQGYGFHELAASASRVYLKNMATSFHDTGTIWEHYAPESGSGAGVKDFVGWSGIGPIALLIESVLGIRVDGARNTVQWRPRLGQKNGVKNLRVGAGTISLVASPVTNGSRTLSIITNEPIHVAVDTGSHQAAYAIAAGTTEITVPAASL